MAEIDYFFEFTNEAAALADSTVAPFLSDPTMSRTNLWGFDLAVNPPVPPLQKPTPYWCMVGQFLTNPSFLAHPNLRFFLVLPATVLYQNMGNIGFVAISANTFKALYAKNWSFGFSATTPGLAIISPAGSWITDPSGNALMVSA